MRDQDASSHAAEIAELRRELADLRREVADLRVPPRHEGTGDVPTPAAARGTRTDRRNLLRAAGGAAVGVVAGTALGGAAPAAAADGDPLLVGQTTLAVDSTVLRQVGGSVGTGKGIFTVTDTADTTSLLAGAIVALVAEESDCGFATEISTDDGVGLYAYASGSDSVGAVLRGGRTTINLAPVAAFNPATPENRGVGDLVFGGTGDLRGLWFAPAVESGSTVWRSLATNDSAGSLHVLPATTRVYDSRPGNPPDVGVKTKLTNGAERLIDTKANSSGVPTNATAVLCNLTVVNTSAAGFVALYLSGIPYPGTSSVNWFQTNSVVANLAVVPLNGSGFIKAKVSAGSSTDLLVDVIGYYW